VCSVHIRTVRQKEALADSLFHARRQETPSGKMGAACTRGHAAARVFPPVDPVDVLQTGHGQVRKSRLCEDITLCDVEGDVDQQFSEHREGYQKEPRSSDITLCDADRDSSCESSPIVLGANSPLRIVPLSLDSDGEMEDRHDQRQR
jgi:hypothetical protein